MTGDMGAKVAQWFNPQYQGKKTMLAKNVGSQSTCLFSELYTAIHSVTNSGYDIESLPT